MDSLARRGYETLRIVDRHRTATVVGDKSWTHEGTSGGYHDYDVRNEQHNAIAGAPEKLNNLPKEKLYNFAWSHDGSQFAYVRGQQTSDVVLLTSFK